MRPLARFVLIALAFALVASVAGCVTGAGSVELEPDETPVPEGMPVMYEFYTDT